MAKTITQKLLLKAGMTGTIVNAPEGFVDVLGALPEGVTLADTLDGQFDFVQVFVKDRDALDAVVGDAVVAVKPGGLLWLCYPKLSSALASDIKRDTFWDILKPFDWRPVTQIALDETWSALRFRPAGDVKVRK